MAESFDFREFNKKWDYRTNILEALLVSSTSEDKFVFPTIEGFILSEVVNGTIDYIGGRGGQINYSDSVFDRDTFEYNLYEYFKLGIKSYPNKKLEPKIGKTMDELCRPYLVYSEQSNGACFNTELYKHFKDKISGMGICQVGAVSSFLLPQEIITKVQEEIFPSLSDLEKKDIKGIGREMRKYIDRDLEFIGKTYDW